MFKDYKRFSLKFRLTFWDSYCKYIPLAPFLLTTYFLKILHLSMTSVFMRKSYCFETIDKIINFLNFKSLSTWHTIQQNVECKKLDGKSGRVSYHTIFVVWSWMELDGKRSDSYDIINSLLEKDNIIRAHCFKNKKSKGLWTINYNLNYNDTKKLTWLNLLSYIQCHFIW